MINIRLKEGDTTHAIDDRLSGQNLYSVVSIVNKDVRYVADQDEFGVIKRGIIVKFPLNAVPVVAESLTDDYAEEMMGIYEDIMDLQLMQIDYAKKYYFTERRKGGKECVIKKK